jgi:hypothetical protein
MTDWLLLSRVNDIRRLYIYILYIVFEYCVVSAFAAGWTCIAAAGWKTQHTALYLHRIADPFAKNLLTLWWFVRVCDVMRVWLTNRIEDEGLLCQNLLSDSDIKEMQKQSIIRNQFWFGESFQRISNPYV